MLRGLEEFRIAGNRDFKLVDVVALYCDRMLRMFIGVPLVPACSDVVRPHRELTFGNEQHRCSIFPDCTFRLNSIRLGTRFTGADTQYGG